MMICLMPIKFQPAPMIRFLLFFTSLTCYTTLACVTVTRRPSSIMLMSDPKPRLQAPNQMLLDDQIMWSNLAPYAPGMFGGSNRITPAENSKTSSGIGGAPYVRANPPVVPTPIDLDLPPGVYKISNAKLAPQGKIGPQQNDLASSYGQQVVMQNPVAPVVVPVTKRPIYQPIQSIAMAQPAYYGGNVAGQGQGIEVYEARKMATVKTYDPNEVLLPGHVYHGRFASTRKIMSVVTRLPNRHHPPATPPPPIYTSATAEWWTARFGGKKSMKGAEIDEIKAANENEDGEEKLIDYTEKTEKQTPPSAKTTTTTTQPTTTEPFIERPAYGTCGYTRYTAPGAPSLQVQGSPPPNSAIGEMINARRNDFPWQVWISLQHQQMTLFGSAAVINDKWLLSSASFIRLANDMTDSIVPLFGLHDAEHVSFSRSSGVFSVPVAGVEFHQSLDFALIKLVAPLNLSSLDTWYRVQPVCLPSACDVGGYDDVCQSAGQTGWIAGWDYSLEDGGMIRKAKAVISANERCENGLGKEWVSKDKICTEGADVCKFGYSGQLVARFPTGNSPRFALCGFATAQDCGKAVKTQRLGVFSRVCTALEWIRDLTGTTTPEIREDEILKLKV